MEGCRGGWQQESCIWSKYDVDLTVPSQLTQLCSAEIAMQYHAITDDLLCLTVGTLKYGFILFWAHTGPFWWKQLKIWLILSCSLGFSTVPWYFLPLPAIFSSTGVILGPSVSSNQAGYVVSKLFYQKHHFLWGLPVPFISLSLFRATWTMQHSEGLNFHMELLVLKSRKEDCPMGNIRPGGTQATHIEFKTTNKWKGKDWMQYFY